VSTDDDVAFLQWALPQLGLRWAGFRKPRGQVLKRVRRRARALGLDGLAEYRRYLEAHPREWARLEPLCRVTISRFYRDRGVFDALRETVLPALARTTATIRCWSAGCASGEEPYTLALVERFAPPGAPLSILATDADPHLLERARRARYPRGALKDLPAAWREAAFTPVDDERRLDPALVARVRFARHDLRHDPWPDGPFELILCRNLAFTYFDAAGQRRALDGFVERLAPSGGLVLGSHERPPDDPRLTPWTRGVWRRG
jgi:chemotaxis protein methyltransferase CheR